ncbi:MAG: lamin tail domain-containing protein [Candidatus Poribacteria bacterium]|nr:lamin tail domain-containing protein [Candidatus Poribacteria bacterium]
MFFNKLRYPLVLVVLIVAGLAFVAVPVTEAVTPVLSVPDEVPDVGEDDDPTQGIQVYGIRVESVSFELTVTFQQDPTADPPVNTPVTGFDAEDIVLQGLDSNNDIINGGATASAVRSSANGSVYTTTITVKGNVNKVNIAVPAESARTHDDFSNNNFVRGTLVPTQAVTKSVEIIRSAAPPLTLSSDKSIGGNAPFTVTLTSTTAITLTEADIKITDGFIPTNGITSDSAKKVWTVTIHPGVGVTQVTVEPSATGAYIFPKGTFTVDTDGPVATITPMPVVGDSVYSVTIAFDEPLQAGATLIASEVSVIGASIGVLSPIADTSSYFATLIPDDDATTVTVQIKAGSVADAGGVPNTATPSPAYTFRVAATGTPPGTGTAPRNGGRDRVTISEIMFASDSGTNDIQWIELYNGKTQTVALNAGSGWELIIENYDDPHAANAPLSGTINFKNKGGVKTIPPEESVLIVSSNGRNSDNTRFASTRVFKVYSELPGEFGMNTRRDRFLHATQGFHIKLVDGGNNLIDEVGNLDGRTRTADEPAWQLPKGWTANGDRSSIIRRYREHRNGRYFNQGIAHDGTEPDGWILAANTAFVDYSRNTETWYGSANDYGTPGIRAAGHPLPVQLSHFRPERTESGAIVIQWTTQSEVDNAGFNILRSQTKTGEFKVVNAQLIPGAGTKAESTTYTWTDATAKPNVVYYYQIEDVSFAGEHQTLATVRLKGFVSAKGKLATQWGVLKKSRD